jgi:hypothetical protein
MNLSDYKKAVQEIHVNSDKIKLRFEKEINEKSKDKRTCNYIFKRPILTCLVLCILIFTFTFMIVLSGGNASNFTITVYASVKNDNLVLSDTPITLSTSSQFNMQGIENDEAGSVKFDLNLICKGDNIEKITYKLSDKIITKENRGEAVAWFAESDSYIIGSGSENIKDERIYESYSYDNKCFLTKMVGNAYSVEYENQNNKNYALVLSLNKNNKGNFTAQDFTITVNILFNDGTSLKRYIFVHPIIGDVTNYKEPHLPKIQMMLKH